MNERVLFVGADLVAALKDEGSLEMIDLKGKLCEDFNKYSERHPLVWINDTAFIGIDRLLHQYDLESGRLRKTFRMENSSINLLRVKNDKFYIITSADIYEMIGDTFKWLLRVNKLIVTLDIVEHTDERIVLYYTSPTEGLFRVEHSFKSLQSVEQALEIQQTQKNYRFYDIIGSHEGRLFIWKWRFGILVVKNDRMERTFKADFDPKDIAHVGNVVYLLSEKRIDIVDITKKLTTRSFPLPGVLRRVLTTSHHSKV